MSAVRRSLVERKLKEMLLDAAERAGIEPGEVAEWLYEEHGVRAGRSWKAVRRAVVRSEVTAQELAVFLLDHGVEVDEEAWIEVVKKYSIGDTVPRLPPLGSGRRGGGGKPRRRGGGGEAAEQR